MSTTLKDIARQTGVSPMAVSSVLNNTKRTRVSEATRKCILEAAIKMGYHRNELATSMRTGSVNVVALIIQFTDYFDLNKVISGILSVAMQSNCGIRIYDISQLEKVFAEILSNRIKKIICLDLDEERRERICRFSDKYNIRLCYILERPHGKYPVVASQLRQAMSNIVKKFCKDGHEKIGIFGIKRDFYFFDELVKGYCDELKAQNIEYDANLVSLETTLEKARKDIIRLFSLSKSKRPTALCCLSDEYALLAVNAAAISSLRIPEDIALFGFGNTVLTQLTMVKISSVEQHLEILGGKAFEMIYRNDAISADNYILLPTKLIERASSRKIK